MKKNIKKGFTLAELLISIAIISIISTMGIVISKKGMDKAYDYYVYNSYKTISSAIGDAISNNYKIDDNKEDWEAFLIYISDLFGGSKSEFSIDLDERYSFISLKNGVVYKFNNTHKGHIRILLPSANSKGRILDFYLDPDHYEYGLIPASNEAYNDSLSVLNRIDLLPFTIDDGEKGKIASRLNEDNLSSFDAPDYLDKGHKAIERYSYKKAFCNIYGTYTNTNNPIDFAVFKIDCDGEDPSEKGVLRLLNPKKVF